MTPSRRSRPGDWELVILQGSGYRPLDEPEEFFADVRSFNQTITGAGGETALFTVWPPRDFPELADDITEKYEQIGRQTEALMLPVNTAWMSCLDQHPEIDLYAPDGSHPSVYGTYLAICVLYSTIYQMSPVGAEYVSDPSITAAERTSPQTVAWETVRQYMGWDGE